MGVRVRVRFILFYYKLASLNRDITCSKLYFDRKRYEEATSNEQHPPLGGGIMLFVKDNLIIFPVRMFEILELRNPITQLSYAK